MKPEIQIPKFSRQIYHRKVKTQGQNFRVLFHPSRNTPNIHYFISEKKDNVFGHSESADLKFSDVKIPGKELPLRILKVLKVLKILKAIKAIIKYKFLFLFDH